MTQWNPIFFNCDLFPFSFYLPLFPSFFPFIFSALFLLIDTSKHIIAMTEMIKRKTNLSNKNSDSNIIKNNDVISKNNFQPKGASSGLKTKNKFLQDFEKLKDLHRNRKGNQKYNIFIYFFLLLFCSISIYFQNKIIIFTIFLSFCCIFIFVNEKFA